MPIWLRRFTFEKLKEFYDSEAKAIAPKVVGGIAGASMVDDAENDDARVEGDYSNSPEEEYAPYTDVTNPPSNDLNRSKKSYPKVAGGDNPMALANKIKEELSSLYAEYKG